jgi:hypothetical protein
MMCSTAVALMMVYTLPQPLQPIPHTYTLDAASSSVRKGWGLQAMACLLTNTKPHRCKQQDLHSLQLRQLQQQPAHSDLILGTLT